MKMTSRIVLVTRCIALSTLLLFPTAIIAYNDPSCSSWPSADAWSELATSLSQDAALHGPILASDYSTACGASTGTNQYDLLNGGNGICMQADVCQGEFCQAGADSDLPAYVLEPQSPQDISAALAFCEQHDIAVSVKTTGHSMQGSSTAKHSLLIWMANYPQDNAVQSNFVDSCGTSYESVIGIGGGETINDVLEGIKNDYHMVTGSCRTVSAAGGWLQGCGLSFTSRQYGIGIDNVVEYEVVLANGTVVTADACANSDLFWALRGGGGGTFGVVTHVQYKVHPVVPVTSVYWSIQGTPSAQEYAAFVNAWLTFWVETSPFLDNRWSGFFGPQIAYLVFTGTAQEARDNFVDEFDAFYNASITPLFTSGNWSIPLPSETMVEFPSWYAFKGGPEAYNNPNATQSPPGDPNVWMTQYAARLFPRDIVVNQPNATRDLLVNLALTGSLYLINYYLGGAMMDIADNATAVHPAMRRALWAIHTTEGEASDMVREFLPNNVTGVSFNHHAVLEPDWQEACWGSNYEALVEIKRKYDPTNRFNCWHCVGYVGKENVNETSDDSECPAVEEGGGANGTTSSAFQPRFSIVLHSACMVLVTVILTLFV